MQKATHITLRCLDALSLDYTSVWIVKRFTRGSIGVAGDATILVRCNLTTRNSKWLKFLDNLLISLTKIQFPGRLEVIDHRVNGPHTYASDSLSQVLPIWPEIVIEKLDPHQLPFKMMFIANRGYWEEIAVPTLIVKTGVPIRELTWRPIVTAATAEISDYIRVYKLHLEIMDMEKL